MALAGAGEGGFSGQAVLQTRHPRAILTLGILLLFTILSYIDRMVLVLLIDPIKRDLLISDVQVSLLQGLAFALCFSLAGLPLGWLADRYSRRWIIYLGITAWSFATAAGGLASSFGELFLARFCVGVGEAALAPAAYTMLADLFPRRQLAAATGVLATGGAIGGGTAVLAGGLVVAWAEKAGVVALPLIGAVQPWQLVFLSFGIPGIIAAFLIFLAPETRRQAPTSPQPHAAAAPGFGRWLAANWLFVSTIVVGTGCLGILAYAVTNWTPAYLSRALGLDPREIGLTLGLVTLFAGIVGFAGSGVMIDWLTARNLRNATYSYLIASGVVSGSMAVAAFALAPNLTVVMICLGLFHMAIPFTTAMVAGAQAGTPRAYRGRMIAILNLSATLVGMIVGPSSVALLTDKVFMDPAKVGWSVAIVCGVAAPLAILIYLAGFRAAARAMDRVRESGE
ncbi:MFS transporter [Sphingomonas crocodyli]|uniref:MFS transporter n=1 Tax=Sphingomonas crocodyli TaxID=1979270 RepID=A0A437MB82_9SPHN|nr:MFS transporter [Sphingomonas crocodyli]RVT94909.1 MFS transporter [Sphingomonas crocodyli]